MFLIGFAGSGKSTVGRALAERIRLPFYDLDRQIEKHSAKSISEIFEQSGERVFRRLELTLLRRLLAKQRSGIVALGGGAYESEALRALTGAHGITVYMSCSARELYRRLKAFDDRPLLRVTPKTGESARQSRMRPISTLLKKRLANYRRADFIVSTTDKTVGQVVRHLQKLTGRVK